RHRRRSGCGAASARWLPRGPTLRDLGPRVPSHASRPASPGREALERGGSTTRPSTVPGCRPGVQSVGVPASSTHGEEGAGKRSERLLMPSRGAGLLQLVVLLALVSGAPVVAAKGFEGPDPAGLTQDKAPDVPQGAAAAEVGPRGLQGSPDAAGRGGAEGADAPEGAAQTLTAPPVGPPGSVADRPGAAASHAGPRRAAGAARRAPARHPTVCRDRVRLPAHRPRRDRAFRGRPERADGLQ